MFKFKWMPIVLGLCFFLGFLARSGFSLFSDKEVVEVALSNCLVSLFIEYSFSTQSVLFLDIDFNLSPVASILKTGVKHVA